ncbi:MAG: PDZ domain-containing protein [Polyangiaceae bacterium]|jgi:predicted metalloprotease with PDZ domain
MALEIVHRVRIKSPATQLVRVETTIVSDDPLPSALVVSMPVWTPGSYLVREYARHVESFAVAPPALFRKVRKNAWRIEPGPSTALVFSYSVYAGELTVRTNHVDETHAFLVGAALFMAVEGHEQLGALLEIEVASGWRAATALAVLGCEALPDSILHRFRTPDFDTLVDSPILLGAITMAPFQVFGVPHRYAIWPRDAVGDAQMDRLVADTQLLIEYEATLFGGNLPYESYELLLAVSPRGRGGLEHRSSSALIVPATSFSSRDGYLDLLSLVAHEVFHAWNVKRIRPEGLTPYRYEVECYTRLLWWFEGATSYYDWRVLVLTGRASVEEYLDHLASELAYLEQTPGRRVISLETASFDAWIKLYRPDENTLNSSVSYYRKGELVCALLDLELRARSDGRATLDQVVGHLWREYGLRERPVPEDGMLAIFEEATGLSLADLFEAWIRSPAEIDVAEPLATVGLAVERSRREDDGHGMLGLRVRSDGGRCVVSAVLRDGAAFATGIAFGDELIAIAGARIDGSVGVDSVLRGRAPNETVEIVCSRDGRVSGRRVTLGPPQPHRTRLIAKPDAPPAARRALAAWLGRTHPAWVPGASGK